MPKIKELRRIAGWTQTRVSRESGINRAKLSQAECGEIELSDRETGVVLRVLLRAVRDRGDRIRDVLAATYTEGQ